MITGVAKLISAFGHAKIIDYPDPIFQVPNKYVFAFVGVIELIIAYLCFSSNRLGLAACLVAWLGSNFLLYRIGLRWINVAKPCPCLGNVTDALHIAPRTADTAMLLILTYLLVGSWAIIIGFSIARRHNIALYVSPNKTVG